MIKSIMLNILKISKSLSLIWTITEKNIIMKRKESLRRSARLFMLDANSEELKELCKGDAIMEKFKENVDKLNDDKTVIDFLTKEEEDEIIKNSYYDDGLEAGLKQGKEFGQMEEKIDLAKKMILKKIDLKDISDITGLSIKELQEL